MTRALYICLAASATIWGISLVLSTSLASGSAAKAALYAASAWALSAAMLLGRPAKQ